LRTSFLEEKVTESVKTTLLEHKDESNNESEKEITSKDCMVIPEI